MDLLPLSLLAGALTVFSPCVLPVLPVVLAGSAAERNRRAPFLVIGSLAVSVFAFNLLLTATTALLGVPSSVWLIMSGGLVAFIGVSLAFPRMWDAIAARVGLRSAADSLSSRTSNKTGTTRSILLGLSWGRYSPAVARPTGSSSPSSCLATWLTGWPISSRTPWG